MPLITIEPIGITISVASGANLLEALKDNIDMSFFYTPCSETTEAGSCGNCRVITQNLAAITMPLDVSGTPLAKLPKIDYESGIRLACVSTVLDDCTIRIPVTITLLPDNVQLEAEYGTNLLEMIKAYKSDEILYASCENLQNGTCGECKVRIYSNPQNIKMFIGGVEVTTAPSLTQEEYDTNWRLACISKIYGPCEVYYYTDLYTLIVPDGLRMLDEYSEDLRNFFKILQPTYEEFVEIINGLNELKVTGTAPDLFFTLLSEMLGQKISTTVPIDLQRRVLDDITEFYASVGTDDAVDLIFRLHNYKAEIINNVKWIAVFSYQGRLSQDAYFENNGYYHEGSLALEIIEIQKDHTLSNDVLTDIIEDTKPAGFLLWIDRTIRRDTTIHPINATFNKVDIIGLEALLPLIKPTLNKIDTIGLTANWHTLGHIYDGTTDWIDSIQPISSSYPQNAVVGIGPFLRPSPITKILNEEHFTTYPNFMDIFDNGLAISHQGSLPYPAVSSELDYWQYNSNDTLTYTFESTSYVAKLSRKRFLNYNHEARLISTDANDNVIGLVLAYVEDGGIQHTLTAVRYLTGVTASSYWRIYYNYAQTDEYLVREDGLGLIHSGNGTLNPIPAINWNTSNIGTKIRVLRRDDLFVCDTTNFGDELYVDAARLAFSLTEDPRLDVFRQPCSVGYMAYAQANVTWIDVLFTGE